MAFSKNTNILPPVSSRLIQLDTVDSSNNYAMQLINEATAVHGDIILAKRQTAGKGQRGKAWSDQPGESLLMSLILEPKVDLSLQPGFLATVALAVAHTLDQFLDSGIAQIKWPNDIILADKKAGGILIENVVRGSAWHLAVIGIGINVAQETFSPELPFATSLKLVGANLPSLEQLAQELANQIMLAVAHLPSKTMSEILRSYNGRLYKQGKLQPFILHGESINKRILGMDEHGSLILSSLNGLEPYPHGSVEWVWE